MSIVSSHFEKIVDPSANVGYLKIGCLHLIRAVLSDQICVVLDSIFNLPDQIVAVYIGASCIDASKCNCCPVYAYLRFWCCISALRRNHLVWLNLDYCTDYIWLAKIAPSYCVTSMNFCFNNVSLSQNEAAHPKVTHGNIAVRWCGVCSEAVRWLQQRTSFSHYKYFVAKEWTEITARDLPSDSNVDRILNESCRNWHWIWSSVCSYYCHRWPSFTEALGILCFYSELVVGPWHDVAKGRGKLKGHVLISQTT